MPADICGSTSAQCRIHIERLDGYGNPALLGFPGQHNDAETGQKMRSSYCAGRYDHRGMGKIAPVHMNGRVYDSSISIFTSADPKLQDLFYSQSLNRYQYVFDNPLMNFDPTGYDGCSSNSISVPTAADGGGAHVECIGHITVSCNAACMANYKAQLETTLLNMAGPGPNNEGSSRDNVKNKADNKNKDPNKDNNCEPGDSSASIADDASHATDAAKLASPGVQIAATGAAANGAAYPAAVNFLGTEAAAALKQVGALGDAVAFVQIVGAMGIGDWKSATYAGIDAQVVNGITDVGIAGAPESGGTSLVAAAGILGAYTYVGGSKGIAQSVQTVAQTATHTGNETCKPH